MVSFPMMKTSLAACFVVALGAATAVAGNSAPATPAATPAATETPPTPSPAALGYAATILNDIGMKPSLDRIVPGLLAELQREVLATRPELKDALGEAVQTVTPEFVKSEQTVVDAANKFLATLMTEQELKDTAAFYESASGKKFQATQIALADRLAGAANGWRQQMSADMVTRVHEEMKKKGKDF